MAAGRQTHEQLFVTPGEQASFLTTSLRERRGKWPLAARLLEQQSDREIERRVRPLQKPVMSQLTLWRRNGAGSFGLAWRMYESAD
jgi:hypothetical protein